MNDLLISEYPLIVLPRLAAKIGLNEAIVLQQVHYWLSKSEHNIDGRPWIYNTYSKWAEQFPFWSERTIMRTFLKLEEQGILLTGYYNESPFDRTKWYSINYDKLVENDTDKLSESGSDNLSHCDTDNLSRCSISEITSEITREGEGTHPVRMDDPPTHPPPPKTTATKPTGPLDARFLKNGLVEPGAGRDGFEVYREIFEYTPSRHQIRTLRDSIDDLSKWRRVLDAWNLTGYRSNNIRGLLDWYHNGIPTFKEGGNGKSAGGRAGTNGHTGRRARANGAQTAIPQPRAEDVFSPEEIAEIIEANRMRPPAPGRGLRGGTPTGMPDLR